jgi:hypothetical protein
LEPPEKMLQFATEAGSRGQSVVYLVVDGQIATAYNVLALPLAAGVLAPFGVVLSPAVGALFMSVSTIVVAINAQLLRRLPLGA